MKVLNLRICKLTKKFICHVITHKVTSKLCAEMLGYLRLSILNLIQFSKCDVYFNQPCRNWQSCSIFLAWQQSHGHLHDTSLTFLLFPIYLMLLHLPQNNILYICNSQACKAKLLSKSFVRLKLPFVKFEYVKISLNKQVKIPRKCE